MTTIQQIQFKIYAPIKNYIHVMAECFVEHYYTTKRYNQYFKLKLISLKCIIISEGAFLFPFIVYVAFSIRIEK
jgi:hypothetical protein